MSQDKQSWEERFDEMLEIHSENHDLYGSGSVSEWLTKNSDSHLYSDGVYGEPMLDLDIEKVRSFIKNIVATLNEDYQKLVLEAENEAYRRGVNEGSKAVAHLCEMSKQQGENIERNRIVAILEKVEAEKWKDAQHCICLAYAIDKIKNPDEALLAINNKNV